MESTRFDRLTRTWALHSTRRSVMGALLGGALGFGALRKSEAKGKSRKTVTLCLGGQTLVVKKSKARVFLNQGAASGACASSPPASPPASPPSPPSPPPPPPVSCSDGVKNGTESDVDCGGLCERCGTNKQCSGRQDCDSARCDAGVCKTCQNDDQCGNDEAGVCKCGSAGICYSDSNTRLLGSTDCNDCPGGTVRCERIQTWVECSPRCGDFLESEVFPRDKRS
jgi:hypothetical protein